MLLPKLAGVVTGWSVAILSWVQLVVWDMANNSVSNLEPYSPKLSTTVAFVALAVAVGVFAGKLFYSVCAKWSAKWALLAIAILIALAVLTFTADFLLFLVAEMVDAAYNNSLQMTGFTAI